MPPCGIDALMGQRISHLWGHARASDNPDALPIHRQQARPLPVRALVAGGHRGQRTMASGGTN